MRRGFVQTGEAARYLELEGEDKRKALDDLKALARHGVPVGPVGEDHDRERAWKLEDSWRHSGIEVTLFERLGLLLGREVLARLLGDGELMQAMQNVDRALASAAHGVETTDADLLRRFMLVQEPRKRYDGRGALISELAAAIGHGYRLTITYRRAGATEVRTYARVRPLTLAIYRSGLYVFWWPEDEDRHFTLAVDRIVDLVAHPEAPFDYPTRGRWNPAKVLDKRFGLQTDNKEPETVRLRFGPASRTYALERQWMPEQHIEERDDGGVDVVFVAEGSELPYRILEWGGFCEVVEPPELRAKVVELARAVLAKHGAAAT